MPFPKVVGSNVVIDATLFAKSRALSGDYRCTWAVSDSNVATYTPKSACDDTCSNQCLIGLVGTGDVTITATCLGQSSSLSWIVTAGGDASVDGDATDD
jgi:hypothetical protein